MYAGVASVFVGIYTGMQVYACLPHTYVRAYISTYGGIETLFFI